MSLQDVLNISSGYDPRRNAAALAVYNSINGKAALVHNHAIADVTGLQAILDSLSGGSGGPTWEYYTANWSTPPVEIASIAGGVVLSYTLNTITRYRFVPDPYDPELDAFYSSFSNPTLSGFILSRG